MQKPDDEIFFAALDYETPQQQENWLKVACGSDADQHARVLKLLKAHHRLQAPDSEDKSLFDQADAVFQAFSSSHELHPGDNVGGIYDLKEVIGEGGVGVVYRAQQHSPIEREVAIKLLKPGMDSQRVLSRFALERRVLEQLDHRGITSIFDAGFQENGRPYFAMQLVRSARTITNYCDEFKLNLRQRIQLMIEVCQTVQYAHQRGVIHRDLKPSNILLEGVLQSVPSPKVIDFGIAKFLRNDEVDSKTFTNLGERFGTPAYMSPEQALGSSDGIDIRTDVYSLGVILFELLTGATPRMVPSNDSSTTAWTSEEHWTKPIILPSDRLRTKVVASKPSDDANASSAIISPSDLKGELDWISVKALAREPAERYQTVADLQKDLERYLVGEPIEAAGPSATYRLRKFIKRNRFAVAIASLTLAAIISTSFAAISLALRAFRAEKTANVRLEEVLRMQKELTAQRDTANSAARRAETLLRIFQIQSATSHALGTYFQEVFKTIGDPASASNEERAQLSLDLDAQNLVQPHPRLIVRGDWRWAADPYPSDIIIGSLQMTSRQAAAEVSTPKKQPEKHNSLRTDVDSNPPVAVGSPTREVKAENGELARVRASFSDILLVELRKVVGDQDPFIAEVLDNAGLNAMEREDLPSAEKRLAEAFSIWSPLDDYLANAVQSKLFLAEVRLRLKAFDLATADLIDAADLISRLPISDPNREPLKEFYNKLRSMESSAP